MTELSMVLLALSLIVLTWAVVRINTRISETQRLLKQMFEAREVYTGSKAST